MWNLKTPLVMSYTMSLRVENRLHYKKVTRKDLLCWLIVKSKEEEVSY